MADHKTLMITLSIRSSTHALVIIMLSEGIFNNTDKKTQPVMRSKSRITKQKDPRQVVVSWSILSPLFFHSFLLYHRTSLDCCFPSYSPPLLLGMNITNKLINVCLLFVLLGEIMLNKNFIPFLK